MKGIIYKYTFPNGKVYIGQTRRNPELRHKEHLDPVTGPCNTGFWKEYQKFKECKYEIIETIEESNEDVLVEKLNHLETYYIIRFHAYDSRYGCNKKLQGTESTGVERVLHKRFQELYTDLLPLRLGVYQSIHDKVWHTKEPLTEEEKGYMNEHFAQENLLWSLPDSFNPDNLQSFDMDEYDHDVFILEEAFSEWKWQLESSLQTEISNFVRENATEILVEMRDKDAICAIDKDGNVVKTFNSFNEIAQYFGVVRSEMLEMY